MITVAFFQWWYSSGWVQQFKRILGRPLKLLKSFDTGTLAMTLFKPWKRDISQAYADTSLAGRFRVMIDNLISRFIGFWIRLITLFVVLAGALILTVFELVVAVTWPVLPFMPIVLIISGVVRL